jgi:hypothetical protein
MSLTTGPFTHHGTIADLFSEAHVIRLVADMINHMRTYLDRICVALSAAAVFCIASARRPDV